MSDTNMQSRVAGIDVGKGKLDVHIHGLDQHQVFENKSEDFTALVAWLRDNQVRLVGIEATGGYERAVVSSLRKAGVSVRVFQPMQVKALGMVHLRRAKTDRIDAALIAQCAATLGEGRPAPDPRLEAMADCLTYIEQVEDDIRVHRTRLESCRRDEFCQEIKADIKALMKRRATHLKKLVASIKEHEDLALRLKLVQSIDGIGTRTAVSLVVLMPELGSMTREEASALAGLAPYDDSSATRTGAKHIAGGRSRVRTSLFAAALPAVYKWNAGLKAFYDRLRGKGKSHKVALIACARKLLIYANTVLANGREWHKQPPKPARQANA